MDGGLFALKVEKDRSTCYGVCGNFGDFAINGRVQKHWMVDHLYP